MFRLLDSCCGHAGASPESGTACRIIWVNGPAGCGKTTLVSSYLDRCDNFQFWYRLDEGDNDIASLFYYLRLAADERQNPDCELPLLTPEYRFDLEVFTRRFFEGLYRILPRPAVIVFDNYEAIDPESHFHNLFQLALAALPAGISVILISRREPPAPFVRFLALQTMKIIGWSDLRLTPGESWKLLESNEEWRFSPEVGEAICNQTGGWAAGLILLAESFKRERPGLLLTESPPTEELFNYFANEVMASISDYLRDFLLATSLLPEMTPKVAGVLTGEPAEKILTRLCRGHFFIERRHGEETVYSFHPLFRKFLRLKAEESLPPGKLKMIREKAAVLLEEAGAIDQAASLFMEAGATDELARLLRRRGPELLAQGRQQTIMDLIINLPDERRKEHPELLYWLGMARQPSDPAGARRDLEAVFERCGKGNELKFLAWAAIVDGFRYEWDDFTPLHRWIDWLDEVVKRGTAWPSPQAEGRVAVSMAAALMIVRPDHPGIRGWIERSVTEARGHPDLIYRVHAYSYTVNYFYWLGDLEAARVLVEEIRQIARLPGAPPLTRLIWLWLEAATNVWPEADYQGASDKIVEALAQAGETGIHIWNLPLLAMGGYAALSGGEIEQARAYIGRIAAGLDWKRRHMVGQYHYLEGWLAAAEGNLAKARSHAEISLRLIKKTGYVFPEIIVLLGQVWISLEAGEPERALPCLEEAEKLSALTGSEIFQYGCLLARARLGFMTGDGNEGEAALARALRLGRNRGFYHLLWSSNPGIMATLCTEALARGIEVEQVREIVKRCRLAPPSSLSDDVAANWPYPLEVATLGGFAVVRDGLPLRFVGKQPRKPLEMLQILIALGGREIGEQRLTDLLWHDADGDAAHKSFEVNLARLRKLLGASKYLNYQNGLLSLDPDWCRVDVIALGNLLREAEKAWEDADRSSAGAKPEAMATAARQSELVVNRYRGDFLPTNDEPWAATCRERLRSRVICLLARLGAYRQESGLLAAALTTYRRGIEIDELNEEFHHRVMACHRRLGQKAEAVAAYRRCCKALAAGLGIVPSARIEELYRQISNS